MINIIYRLCEQRDGTHGSRPEWFSKKNCLKSFITACIAGSSHIKNIYFLHDGPEGELYEFLDKQAFKPNIIKINEGNYIGSQIRAYELAKSFDDGCDLYFVEDDYLHLIDSIDFIGLALNQFELLSPYDHVSRYDPIKYTGKNDEPYELKIVYNAELWHHWRTNESACHTFAITNKCFHDNYSIITHPNSMQHDQNFFNMMRRIANVETWTPIPALASQVDQYMSPCINWKEISYEY